MKRLLMIILILAGGAVYAQDGSQDRPEMNDEMMKKIEAARIALITERLDLTPEQAEKFWPVYREFTEQRRGILRELRDIKRQADGGVSEERSKDLVQQAYRLKQRELSLEQTYSERLMDVISAKQLMSLKRAEDDFTRELLRRIERRRENQMRRQEMQDRREEFQKDKRGN